MSPTIPRPARRIALAALALPALLIGEVRADMFGLPDQVPVPASSVPEFPLPTSPPPSLEHLEARASIQAFQQGFADRDVRGWDVHEVAFELPLEVRGEEGYSAWVPAWVVSRVEIREWNQATHAHKIRNKASVQMVRIPLSDPATTRAVRRSILRLPEWRQQLRKVMVRRELAKLSRRPVGAFEVREILAEDLTPAAGPHEDEAVPATTEPSDVRRSAIVEVVRELGNFRNERHVVTIETVEPVLDEAGGPES
jgi:hypothetical protein